MWACFGLPPPSGRGPISFRDESRCPRQWTQGRPADGRGVPGGRRPKQAEQGRNRPNTPCGTPHIPVQGRKAEGGHKTAHSRTGAELSADMRPRAHSREENRPPPRSREGAAARTPPRKDGGWSVGDGRDFLGAESNGAGGALLGKLGHPISPKSTTTGRETQSKRSVGRFEVRPKTRK